jgi:ribosomal protein S12 methylthiotransferase
LEKYKIGIISLGCDKNRIDSENMLGNLNQDYIITKDPKEADIIIVNTCGFIESSKQESIDTILEMAKYKNKYNCKILIATGCLTQRYKKDLQELMPEIDIILGVNNYNNLNESIQNFLGNKRKIILCNDKSVKLTKNNRILSTSNNYAYVKIAEGCDNFCTYCIIPKIRGRYQSRDIEDILSEVNDLVKKEVKEIILVAQDTTLYGTDIYGEKKLHELLRKISEIDGVKWVRVLYCYPEEIYDELIDELAKNDKVCKYIDMPIQHISNNILKLMGRRGRKEYIYDVIKNMKQKIKGISLRTTVIVGFPGETEHDFNELNDFIEDVKFDNLGVFTYSQEEGTPAATMENQIDEDTKKIRREKIMIMQQKISKQKNQEKIGNIYDVVVEGKKDNFYVARTYSMAPEVDGNVFVNSGSVLKKGDFIKVKITDAMEYDLIGEDYNESCK